MLRYDVGGPCMCGAIDCPSCGPAQGYSLDGPEDDREDDDHDPDDDDADAAADRWEQYRESLQP